MIFIFLILYTVKNYTPQQTQSPSSRAPLQSTTVTTLCYLTRLWAICTGWYIYIYIY
jgi:hypothetical protein